MPTKLIAFILILVVIVTFIGFNIENTSDIKLIPGENGTLSDVPIFLSFFVMYVIGVVSVIPFFFSWQTKKKKSDKPVDPASEGSPEPEKKKKVRVLGSKKNKNKESGDAESPSEEETETEESKTEETPT